MNRPRDCHAKSEKDKYHTILLICGILKKKWYKWAYLQNRNGDTDVENRLKVMKGKGGEE